MQDKDKFKQMALENLIFNDLKDSSFPGANYIRRKYQGLDIDFTRLYRRIVNYQINKYGTNLYKANCFKTREEFKKAKRRAVQRKYERLNR